MKTYTEQELRTMLERLRLEKTLCITCKIKGRDPKDCYSCAEYNRVVEQFNTQLDEVINLVEI